MRVYNVTKEKELAESVVVADTFAKRLKGLIGRKLFQAGKGFLLLHCKGIHTFGMKFPIDVLYLNSNYEVVHIIENMKPNRMGLIIRQAECVLELPVNTVSANMTEVGDYLKLL